MIRGALGEGMMIRGGTVRDNAASCWRTPAVDDGMLFQWENTRECVDGQCCRGQRGGWDNLCLYENSFDHQKRLDFDSMAAVLGALDNRKC